MLRARVRLQVPIPHSVSTQKMSRFVTLMEAGGPCNLIKIYFFLFSNPFLRFVKKISIAGFITSTSSENDFC
jgi:hypothetical protein